MILLENGRFLIPNGGGTNSMLVEDGFILSFGKSTALTDQHKSITKRYNLGGRYVWPGLTDAHIHLTSFGLNLDLVDCETGTLQECLNRIETVAVRTSSDDWILGHGWNQNNWQDGYGTALQLDPVSHGHPVFLTAKSLHAAWVNTRAMQLAEITSKTPDPDGGKILRDAGGNPSGIFLEKSEYLIRTIIPHKTARDINHAILRGIETLNKFGVTSVHDFDSFERFKNYQQLESEELLQIRILKAIPPDDHQKALDEGYHTGIGTPLVHIGPFKFFMDGALGPHTAAMLEPYQDDLTNKGLLNHKANEIIERSMGILATGSDLSIHAIGDYANQETIKAYRSIREKENITGQKPVKLRIEHAQLLSPEILTSFKELGIYASMQPLHATSDMEMAEKYWGDRSRLAYAWKSLLDYGANLVFGSDAPVESPNPFLGLHAAVTRQRPDGFPGSAGWIPEERITLKHALNAYTREPAELSRFGLITGSLEPGSAADLILLDSDPFTEKVQDLQYIKPVATMFNGKWIWVDQGVTL